MLIAVGPRYAEQAVIKHAHRLAAYCLIAYPFGKTVAIKVSLALLALGKIYWACAAVRLHSLEAPAHHAKHSSLKRLVAHLALMPKRIAYAVMLPQSEHAVSFGGIDGGVNIKAVAYNAKHVFGLFIVVYAIDIRC